MNKYFVGQSIQVTLDGFSFFKKENNTTEDLICVESAEIEHIATPDELSAVESIEWSTPKVLILPFEVFDNSMLVHYLRAARLIDESRAKSERALFAVWGDFVALWSADNATWEYIEEMLPGRLHTHPLLRLIESAVGNANTIAIELYDNTTLHIVVCGENGAIEASQSIVVKSLEDALYHTIRLSGKLNTKELLASPITSTDVINYFTPYFKTQPYK